MMWQDIDVSENLAASILTSPYQKSLTQRESILAAINLK